MTTPESDPVSSIRAVRPVIPSQSLRGFIRSAEKLFVEHELDLSLDPAVEPLVFAANGLHSTLFARRVPANSVNNERLEKVENYIRSPWHYSFSSRRRWAGGPLERIQSKRHNPLSQALEDLEELWVPDKRHLFLSASSIVCSATMGIEGAATELSLLIDDGPVADMLLAQSELLHEAAKRPNAASLLPREDKVDNPLELPFMRAAFVDSEAVAEFVDGLKSELPVFEVGLRPISYRHELVG
ncbi:MAG TPA: hypothetical protein VN031_03605 [Candidatus Microsaccharimonas sp.]|nr:hypothetical protein [Candidatus Microsaccharimonas sp.]